MKQTTLALLTLFTMATGCSKDKEKEYSYDTASVRRTEGDNTGLLDKTLLLDVVFATGACSSFHEFLVTEKDADTTLVTVRTKAPMNQMCTANIITLTTGFRFKPKKKGTHYLKFLRGNGIYLTDTLTIN